MASTKSTGSTKLGRDSISKRLGIKKNHGEHVRPGEIILRQRGTRVLFGAGVKRGADDTLYALIPGTVQFAPAKRTRFDGSKRLTHTVSVKS